jgi:arabinose-5-phosphate isomerase
MNRIQKFQEVLNTEASALINSAAIAGEEVIHATDLLLRCKGKIIISGIGKSGIVGRKMASTFSSIGLPAVFLHASEALHGDVGVCKPDDVAILISNSGSTAELLKLIPVLKSFAIPVVSILGKTDSSISKLSDVVLNASCNSEADTLNLVPTVSSTLAMAIGDALAVVVMHEKNFSKADFSKLHPGGQIGKNLLLKVGQVMHDIDHIARVKKNDPWKNVIIEMTRFPLGAACVVNENNELQGIITEGDIRRKLLDWNDMDGKTAADMMTINPAVISSHLILLDAIDQMENRASKISVLPVVDDNLLRGLIRIHDVY